MPELPEVEVTRRALLTHLVGASILQVWLGKPLRWPMGLQPSALVGRTFTAVERRSKYLLLHMDEGVLLVHLGMSGSLQWVPSAASRLRQPALAQPFPGPHDHFVCHTHKGTLILTDPRRFGAVIHADSLATPSARRLLQHLGVEPLGPQFTPEHLLAGLAKHRMAIKNVLLSGAVVVGVGNIYASEALFRARIHPATPANAIHPTAAQRLHAAILTVLSTAVEMGGSTLRNFASPSGAAGHFQTATQVYGRQGQPCLLCQTPIERTIQGQRATYHCPKCQPGADPHSRPADARQHRATRRKTQA